MFSKNLSASLLQTCEENKLTYEAASARCQISTRFFSDIVRRRSAPTIRTLEKMCVGLKRTPNELLMPPPAVPTEPGVSRTVCPHCGAVLELRCQMPPDPEPDRGRGRPSV